METAHEVNWNFTDSAERNDKEDFLVPKCFVIF